jgi:hypothetical protein
MQLIQIGEPHIPTIQQLIEQMAARQFDEIEQLKQAAIAKESHKQSRLAQRRRCKQHARQTSLRNLAA